LTFALEAQLNGYCDPGPHGQSLRSNILFTDESWIDLHPKPNSQNTRIRTNDKSKIATIHVPKHSLKVLVAGGMTMRGVTKLHIVKDGVTIRGSYYCREILPIYLDAATKSDLFSNNKKITFMQDGAGPHKFTGAMTKLRSTFDRLWAWGIWPGNSPDLNPIEHLWAKIQDSVFIEPRPKDRDSLIERIQLIWKSFDRKYLENLVESFPKQMESVINNEGGNTKY